MAAPNLYGSFVKSPVGGLLAKQLGLPRPAHLPRRADRDELVLSPAVVLGDSTGADDIAARLLDWGADVRRRADDTGSVGSLLLVLDDLRRPEDIAGLIQQARAAVKKLQPGGRIITVSRTPDGADPVVDSARGAVEGLLRSLGHEVRRGATANGIQVAPEFPLSAVSVEHALRFFLSARSAFVDGQLLRIDADTGTAPADWNQPLAGRTIVVTGAARGIGEAIARTLAADGADLILVDMMNAGTELSRLATELGGRPVLADVTQERTTAALIAAADGSPIDGVVHNAGITRDKLFANMTQDRWEAVIAVNLRSQLAITRALRDEDALGADYRHVGIASTSGIAGNRGQTNYAASKAGVMAYVDALAGDLAESGGTANAVAPGFIETEMTATMPVVTREVARLLNSLHQGGLPQDVAEAVAFLLSPAAGGIRGETLRVCGQNLVGR
ncbi:3-oxoacyl-ACP reductase [Helcobacillus massiliensis]|uniref:3-oxoacyl-[acyl-carrier protein] reductase n=1 Tax=Helcobacillus massiliensis TaxID=521392 RepID=A0A839QR22_9MICO|nr:3-oxoacyl-ACP reductase [Helcobacillus massiliensis]MBB3022913.1 3-oxoacyl-[acyl-carrier protein] reductase [Helcobacillus massiliensis]